LWGGCGMILPPPRSTQLWYCQHFAGNLSFSYKASCLHEGLPSRPIHLIRLLWEELDMRFGSAAEVKDATPQKRDDVARASQCFHIFAEGRVGIFWRIGLRPLDLNRDSSRVELRGRRSIDIPPSDPHGDGKKTIGADPHHPSANVVL